MIYGQKFDHGHEQKVISRSILWYNGGGSNNKKDHAAGKNPRCPLSFLFFFCSFSKHVQNRRFCAEFGQKCVLKKKTKKIMIFVFFDFLCSFLFFFVLFCCFCRIWLTKCPQTENKKEQKRLCRRENRKMSFVFCVVGPPYNFGLTNKHGKFEFWPWSCSKIVAHENMTAGRAPNGKKVVIAFPSSPFPLIYAIGDRLATSSITFQLKRR